MIILDENNSTSTHKRFDISKISFVNTCRQQLVQLRKQLTLPPAHFRNGLAFCRVVVIRFAIISIRIVYLFHVQKYSFFRNSELHLQFCFFPKYLNISCKKRLQNSKPISFQQFSIVPF